MSETAAAGPAREARWGGAALALAGILYVMGVVLGLRAFGGAWDTSVGATLPDAAALIHERWTTFRAVWLAELLGTLLMALAAFLLRHRPQEGLRRTPTAVAWIVVGIGSVIMAAEYSFVLGSYPAALDAFAEQPALFAAIRGGVLFMHMTGSTLQILGLLTALVIEVRWKGRGVPDRLVNGAAGVTLLGVAAAVVGLIRWEYGAGAFFLASALLGLAIWIRPAGACPPPGPSSGPHDRSI